MKNLRIHYFQHVSFEDPGSILEWASERGHSLTSTKLFEKFVFPEMSEFDWLIIMGGPMSVNDEDRYRWLVEEKSFIRRAIGAGKTVLGICLGSQLISSALGARVYRNSEPEIGWYDIEFTETAGLTDLFPHVNGKWKVFHWHGDTFDLPAGAIHLARSAACKNQAYIYNDRVVALQFHPEPTIDLLERMIEHGSNELIPGKYVMTDRDQLLNKELTSRVRKDLFSLLDRLPV